MKKKGHRSPRHGRFTRISKCRTNPTNPHKGHIGFAGLESRIEKSEKRAHPRYGKARIEHIAKAAAGKVYRARQRAGKPK